MESPSVVNLEGHPSGASSGLQKFTTQELNSGSSLLSADGSVDHRGDYGLCEAESSLWKPDKDFDQVKNTQVSVSRGDLEFVEGLCLQQPEQVSVVTCGALLDLTPAATIQLHDGGVVSTLDESNEKLCPVPVTEDSSDLVVQNQSDQIGDLNCGCVKSDFEGLETVSNGHDLKPQEDLCPAVNLDSSPSPVPTATDPDPGRKVSDLPRIIKHKPSSISFSNYTCASVGDGHAYVNESSDDGESSSEEDHDHDDSDDDVFLELPQSRELQANHRKRSKGKQKRRGAASVARNGGYEAEEESRNKEESPQVKSPWSASMSQLMMKLDQLHLDIEEALSASSSPSDTPCTTRKKQWAAVSKSTSNQTPTLKDPVLQRPEGGDCPSQDRSSAPHRSSAERKETTKKTMFNKMTNAAGAVRLQVHMMFSSTAAGEFSLIAIAGNKENK
ncbi:Hypothetical predicted protein [Xyrichtys novacula]|uniref:Uncharacterized protein n=1 Tax=Xyrichtys novacula TaxID=13765 RepID=A0AAV1FVW0_XYRNO|nr:Hypothetical predicted protein [Xyrichtys novacula]